MSSQRHHTAIGATQMKTPDLVEQRPDKATRKSNPMNNRRVNNELTQQNSPGKRAEGTNRYTTRAKSTQKIEKEKRKLGTYAMKHGALISRLLGFRTLRNGPTIDTVLPRLQFSPLVQTLGTRFYSCVDWGASSSREWGEQWWGLGPTSILDGIFQGNVSILINLLALRVITRMYHTNVNMPVCSNGVSLRLIQSEAVHLPQALHRRAV